MAAKKVSDAIIERLQQWGVDYLFGYPGDGINGILGALNRAGDKPRLIQARHEEMAAFEAVGYAKFTGRVGVCLATSGPGAVHLLNGLYDGRLDHVPMVAIVGQQARTSLGGHYQQEIDLSNLFKDVAGEFVLQVDVPQQFPNAIDRAMRIAMAQRTPTAVIVPNDLQEVEYTPPPHAFKMVPSTLGYSLPEIIPAAADIQRAADVLNAGSKVAILAGQGARAARDEVLQVAELFGAGISKALVGKDVVPDDHPLVCGSIGLLGTKPSWELMMGCDTLFIVGSSFPYGQFLPPWDQARAVQIDIDAGMLGMRYPLEVGLNGDAKDTLTRMLPLLQRKSDRSWEKKITGEIGDWWKLMDERAHAKADPINPQLPFWELNSRLPDDAILSSDSGSSANWYARDVKIRGNMRGSLSGNFATMGPGVPYAFGAKWAHPDRPAIALVGDGAMQMNGMAELLSFAKYYRDWKDPRAIVMVLNNSDLNQVTWEMRAMEGDPKFEASQDLPPCNYADFANSIGLRGIRVEKPRDVGKAWDAALAADRPAVLDIVVDPEVPPIPPHVELDQALALTRAMLKGDEGTIEIVKEGTRQKIFDFLPGR